MNIASKKWENGNIDKNGKITVSCQLCTFKIYLCIMAIRHAYNVESERKFSSQILRGTDFECERYSNLYIKTSHARTDHLHSKSKDNRPHLCNYPHTPTHYRHIDECLKTTQTDGRYQVYYLPASRLIKILIQGLSTSYGNNAHREEDNTRVYNRSLKIYWTHLYIGIFQDE